MGCAELLDAVGAKTGFVLREKIRLFLCEQSNKLTIRRNEIGNKFSIYTLM